MSDKSLKVVSYKVTRSVVSGPRNHRRIAYVWPKGETVMENLQNRRIRPVDAYREAVNEVLQTLAKGMPAWQAKLVLDKKPRWSQKAGCSCGCSPGFLLSEHLPDGDIHIEVE